MPEMPKLGQPPTKSNPIIGVTIAALAVGLIAGGVMWWKQRVKVEAEPQAVAAAPQPASPETAAPAGATAPTPAAPVAGAVPAPGAPVVPPPASADGLKAFTVSINGPMESAIVGATDRSVGPALTQVVNRSLVWWVRVPQDLVRGDTLSAVYAEVKNHEPVVHAVRFSSGKLGKTMEAYRFQPKGAPHARFYLADGTDLETHLVDSPLENWEQITSLLSDGRRHQGVDFKTPVGTNVRATFDGVITRRNWSFRGNGNSLEVKESGGKGRTAMFLHLDELPKDAQAGRRVKRGDVIARSGNTGHSFAPHLHYQLLQGGKVVDPFKAQSTRQQALDTAHLAAFQAEQSRLKALLPPLGADVGG